MHQCEYVNIQTINFMHPETIGLIILMMRNGEVYSYAGFVTYNYLSADDIYQDGMTQYESIKPPRPAPLELSHFAELGGFIYIATHLTDYFCTSMTYKI